MAISNILPRKIMKNRTRQQSMAERHDYDQKEEKTDGGELVSSYMCSPETAAVSQKSTTLSCIALSSHSSPVRSARRTHINSATNWR